MTRLDALREAHRQVAEQQHVGMSSVFMKQMLETQLTWESSQQTLGYEVRYVVCRENCVDVGIVNPETEIEEYISAIEDVKNSKFTLYNVITHGVTTIVESHKVFDLILTFKGETK